MPKMKTHRGAAKRFKGTASGRVKHKKPYHSHILTSKTTKRKRHLRQGTCVSSSELKSLKRLLPYL
jgi:large subunit ribosomal protein L35